ncbi:MAG TPA: hypothetical protein VFV81_00145 [Verrucomicrobiae bacterium]|nr:hypothetical protein [Verrucomicrobiae bacterium]
MNTRSFRSQRFSRPLWLAAGLFLFLIIGANGAVWQWSVPMGKGRAFLWIPPDCKQVRAVVVGQNNMIEQGILEHPEFRAALAKENIGEVFIAPPFDFVFRFDQGAGDRFDDLMDRLAGVSGYSELKFAPVAPLGHSACASYPWNFAAWNPGRTLAVLSVHGDAPLTKFPGSGRPNPDWGDRSIDGVPGLMVMAEYEWGDSEHGVDRLTPALEYKNRHPQTPLAMLAEPGEGHFNYSDKLVRFLATFIRKAAEERLPSTMPLDRPPVLKPIDPAKGWLVQRWHLNQARTVKPAPYAKYAGDPKEAFWAFDKEMAWAIQDYLADQPGKRPQLLSVTTDDVPLTNGCGEPVNLPFVPDADGVTFHVKTAFMDFVPGDAQHNQNAARWAYLPAGSKLGHATGGGPIRLHQIVGPATQTGPDTFRLSLNRVNWCNPERGHEIWIWASHPGDAHYKSIVQQASIRVPEYTTGAEQHLTFPAIPDQRVNTGSLKLDAVSDAGLKVDYYVAEGPAEVEGDLLKFTKIPPRAKFPLRVTVVAWQHGLPGKIQGAPPVAREFLLRADSLPAGK